MFTVSAAGVGRTALEELMYMLDDGQELDKVGLGELIRKQWVRIREDLVIRYRHLPADTRQLRVECDRLRNAEVNNKQLTAQLQDAWYNTNQLEHELKALGAH